MNLANALTMFRLIAAPVFVFLLVRETRQDLWAASILFVVATLTDAFDGYFARRKGTITHVGRWLDPIADKVLICGTYLAFLAMGVPAVKAWMVAAIIGREVLVSALRSLAGRRGIIIHSSQLAKWKTGFQMGVAMAILALMCLRSAANPSPGYWIDPGSEAARTSLVAAILLTITLTILSGVDYVWKNREVFRPLQRGKTPS
jgi:CDP-diacylglycerol--glycerol-3-phosphate 3-phosphatidyltransferase